MRIAMLNDKSTLIGNGSDEADKFLKNVGCKLLVQGVNTLFDNIEVIILAAYGKGQQLLQMYKIIY